MFDKDGSVPDTNQVVTHKLPPQQSHFSLSTKHLSDNNMNSS